MSTLTFENVRCNSCGKLLAELVSAPYRIACPRCGTLMSCLLLATQEVVEGYLRKNGERPQSED